MSQFAVPGYRNEENMWEKIFTLDGTQSQNNTVPPTANPNVERQMINSNVTAALKK